MKLLINSLCWESATPECGQRSLGTPIAAAVTRAAVGARGRPRRRARTLWGAAQGPIERQENVPE